VLKNAAFMRRARALPNVSTLLMARRIVLFELNEVPWSVLDAHCLRHPDGALARLRASGEAWETEAGDAVLSPWITWPTVHRGVSDQCHRIRHLGQDVSEADRRWPPVWRIVADSGAPAAVFGSLHSAPVPADAGRYGFYVPDPFAPTAHCHPPRLAAFQRLNLAVSRASARNVARGLPWPDAVRFLARAPLLGLRASTALSAAAQLAAERLRPWRRVRRRTYQAVLGFDVFLSALHRSRPAFATFFTNHVASAMHRYWAAAFPGDYERSGYTPEWRARFAGEIDFAMRWADRLLGRLLRFVEGNPGYELWVASSMGQAATTADPLHSQVYVTDVARFMAALGVDPGGWSERPAMAPEVSVYVDPALCGGFRRALSGLSVAGQPVDFDEPQPGFFGLCLGQADVARPVAELHGREVPFETLGLSSVAIEDGTNTNAYHVREGVLLVHRPRADAPPHGRRRASTLEIAPALLRALGIAPPPYMADTAIALG
jgi:hypothetical protein